MCGEHRRCILNVTPFAGSSPHVRGARDGRGRFDCGTGIIPACAGSTFMVGAMPSRIRDHPRMCGEHRCGVDAARHGRGSSPHVRGALSWAPACRASPGIIPACAGSTCRCSLSRSTPRDHPRMCGEHASGDYIEFQCVGSSPHVRGAHFENSIIPRKRKDNWLFFIQFRFENFLAFRYLLALLHPFLGVPTKDPSFASLGRLINCNPSQSTGDQSAPYTLKAICCSFLAE